MSKYFEVTSGIMVCSDPCYEIPTWCQGIVDNVKNGKWEANVASFDRNRISALWVFNVDAAITNPAMLDDLRMNKGRLMPFTGGVDSGQFGFFDREHYYKDEAFYKTCCDLTLSEDNWGTLSCGAVSSSGNGDGDYLIRGIKDDNDEFVGFSVRFIGDDNDDEDDYWDDDSDEDVDDDSDED